jgi:hypothetical protein
VDDAVIQSLKTKPLDEIDHIDYYWELGATLKDMLIAADHAMHVVRSVKALGAQQPDRTPDLDINECVREALTLLSSPLRKVTVNLTLEPVPLIYGNKGELVQVLINMIQNSCESLTSTQFECPNLQIATHHEGRGVILIISDNGPGIPEHILPRIFEPSLTTKNDGNIIGLGLGLTIVKRIVDSYQGRISVQSQPGKTTFTVRLPIKGGDNVYD